MVVANTNSIESLQINGSTLTIDGQSYELNKVKAVEVVKLRTDDKLAWAGTLLALATFAMLIHSYTSSQDDDAFFRSVSLIVCVFAFIGFAFLISFDNTQYIYAVKLKMQPKKWKFKHDGIVVMCFIDEIKAKEIKSLITDHLTK